MAHITHAQQQQIVKQWTGLQHTNIHIRDGQKWIF